MEELGPEEEEDVEGMKRMRKKIPDSGRGHKKEHPPPPMVPSKKSWFSSRSRFGDCLRRRRGVRGLDERSRNPSGTG